MGLEQQNIQMLGPSRRKIGVKLRESPEKGPKSRWRCAYPKARRLVNR